MIAEVISTKNGKVKGKFVDLKIENGKPVYVYRNIPFAKPPLGKLRFMPPQPADPWDGIKDGTVVGNMPMTFSTFKGLLDKAFPLPKLQGSGIVNEDCLHVTVYSPHPEKRKKLPVMVYMYGGGYSNSSEYEYDGTVLASMNDVVIVIPNYRIGTFGFLSLGPKSVCTGNAGLMDQQLALKWVKENIEVFGGDKNNVTIFGESAGGVSVHYHLVSPLSRGLFHKAISHSGQISMRVLFNSEKANEIAREILLDHFKIDETDDVKLLEQLQNMPAEELVKIQAVFEKKRRSFLPTLDGKVFEKTPKQYLADKEVYKVPYMSGCNNNESSGLFGVALFPDFEKGIAEEMAKAFMICPLTDEGWEECKKFYGKTEKGEDRFSKIFAAANADALFLCPAIHDASVHAESGAPVYAFIGNFQLKIFHDEEYGEAMKKPDWCICDHGDDLFLTFGLPLHPGPHPLGIKYTKEEAELSRKWMTYITNFAKSGDPNIGEAVEKPWPKYTPGGEHLAIGHEMTTLKNYAAEETKFWFETMPAFFKED